MAGCGTVTTATPDLFTRLIRHPAAPALLLVLAALLAMVCVNSPLAEIYHLLLRTPAAIQIGGNGLAKPLLLWINDGLMAIFFFSVGLELKREVLHGMLRDTRTVLLPGIAALGGMLVPAGLYLAITAGDSLAQRGWAIPVATDIAFVLGVLALLGKRIPHGLRLFLLALAIFDDLGAVIIIALFYTAELSKVSLLLAAGCLILLAALNYAGVRRLGLYVVVGLLLWVSVLNSGVHATLAGVVLALFIPHLPDPLYTAMTNGQRQLSGRDGSANGVERRQTLTIARRLELALEPWVAFFILPLFAFANAGIDLRGVTAGDLLNPVPLGIVAGLFVGKQAGVFLFAWLTIGSGCAALPAGVSWRQLYGGSILCGIGFTMSLFIASLAFEHGGLTNAFPDRLGILAGTMLSAVIGYLILRGTTAARPPVVTE